MEVEVQENAGPRILLRMRSPVICGVRIGRDGKSASPVELNSAYLCASEHCNQRVGGLEPSGS
jgi:hypothetical protein